MLGSVVLSSKAFKPPRLGKEKWEARQDANTSNPAQPPGTDTVSYQRSSSTATTADKEAGLASVTSLSRGLAELKQSHDRPKAPATPPSPTPTTPLRYNDDLRLDQNHRKEVRNRAAARAVSFEQYTLYYYEKDFGRSAFANLTSTNPPPRIQNPTPARGMKAINPTRLTPNPGRLLPLWSRPPKTVSRETVRSKAASRHMSYERYMLYHFKEDFGSETQVV